MHILGERVNNQLKSHTRDILVGNMLGRAECSYELGEGGGSSGELE